MPDTTTPQTPNSAKRLSDDINAYIKEKAKAYGYSVRTAHTSLILTSARLGDEIRTVATHYISEKAKRKHITASIVKLTDQIALTEQEAYNLLNPPRA